MCSKAPTLWTETCLPDPKGSSSKANFLEPWIMYRIPASMTMNLTTEGVCLLTCWFYSHRVLSSSNIVHIEAFERAGRL